MADLVITPSQVVAVSGNEQTLPAASAITAGQPCYRTSDSTWELADTDDTVVTAAAQGIALNSAPGVGQPVTCLVDGEVTLGAGAAPVQGTVYVLSATPGGIAPVTDLVTGDWVTVLGVGNAANGLTLIPNLFASGVQVP